jgi:signal transduction histidine kinase
VINKALVYGALAVFITGAYVGIVVGIGRAIGSERNLGLSIAATALVALAFQPVRERAQRFANRLIYGKRATPYEVLSEFSGGMAQAVATEELLPRMARIVAEGTGAARADIWLMVGSGLALEASWPADAAPPALVPAIVNGEVAAEGGTTAVTVRHQGQVLGVIGVTQPPNEQIDATGVQLLEDLASQAGLVLRNVRLLEDVKDSRQRLVTAQDEERRRLERNLHDGAQQRLVAIALALKMARNLVKDGSDPVGERIDQASEELSLALAELREFARGIHPAILTERGLDAALRSLAERSSVPTTVDSSLNGRLPDAVETTIYFAVSEALTNVAKYSAAKQVAVIAEQEDGTLRVTVRDDGVGGADPSLGSGLRGLADRVAVVDGDLAIDSPPGGGTTLEFRIPVAAGAGA